MKDRYPDGTAVYVENYNDHPVYSGVVAGTVDQGLRYVVRPDSPELEETAVPRSFVKETRP